MTQRNRRAVDQGFLQDERGARSLGRLSWIVVLALDALAVFASGLGADFAPEAWALLATLTITAGSWVAGPRIAQYIGGQLGATVKGIADAARAGAEKLRAKYPGAGEK